MKTLLILASVCVLAALTGCMSTQPVNTTLDLGTEPFGFHYASEKDVMYSRTVTDPDNGVTEAVSFQALASAAALAQAERDKAAAEANRAQAESLSQALQALVPLIPQP